MRSATLLATALIGVGSVSPLSAAAHPRDKECMIQGERIDCSCLGKSDKRNSGSQARCRDDRVGQGASLSQTPVRPVVR